MKPAICTNCGATLSVDENLESGTCEYCGTKYITEKAITQFNNTYNIQNNTTTINNYYNTNDEPVVHIPSGTPKNKNIALVLCILFGMFGAHKFYEGKTGMGLVYLFTAGLFMIGWIADIISLLKKPNPYYV